MTTELPRWDVSAYYPSLDSPELAAATEAVGAGMTRLVALYDEHDVRGGADRTADPATVAALEEVLTATNALLDEHELVEAYVYAFLSTDSDNDLAASVASRLETDMTPMATLSSRLSSWVDSIGTDALVEASTIAADHAWPLRKAALQAEHQMSEAEESLAADLDLTGASAWYRLYADVTSRITATVGGEVLPVTAVRNLAYDPDPQVREEAFRAEVAAWEAHAVPIAASLNAIKGQALVLQRRRGWSDPLTPALFGNAVTRRTFDAMQAAVVDALPDLRRYLRTKSRLLGKGGAPLPWWDLYAPIGTDSGGISWEAAVAQVTEAFATYSPRLADLVGRAVRESWIDVAPRAGKAGGAFCMPMTRDESRVLLNFGGTLDAVSTLAHELGHAYHNTTLAGRTFLQRQTPMALAETASIFCETILVQSALATADDAQRLVLLETDLLGATQVVTDIHSRVLFETELFRQRAEGPLSVTALNEAMLDAQRQAFGDALDHDALHPYMWAVKPHYYGTHYYNWPYTFGLLFGLGLYARHTEDPERFREGYDDLLSATGLGQATELAARFGIDVEDQAFWSASLDVIRGRVDELERLAG